MRRRGASGDAPRSTKPERDRHIPVLLSEVVESLAPADNQLVIDGTFGAGGYTRAILEAADCRVLAFDRDITAVRAAAPMIAEFSDRLRLINRPFSDMEPSARAAEQTGADQPFVDGVVLDIGVSSMQLDQAERGFSFQTDGPLDMRMSETGASAADFVNTADEETIANVIYTYGEEHKSRSIARAIVKARTETRSRVRSNWPTLCRACFMAGRSMVAILQREHFRRCASTSTMNSANSRARCMPPSAS